MYLFSAKSVIYKISNLLPYFGFIAIKVKLYFFYYYKTSRKATKPLLNFDARVSALIYWINYLERHLFIYTNYILEEKSFKKKIILSISVNNLAKLY